MLVVVASISQASATVLWEDYRGSNSVALDLAYIGTPGAPKFANSPNSGAMAPFRALTSNPANAARSGSSANIDFRGTDTNTLCNNLLGLGTTACLHQAQGRVVYALIQFPAAGTYTMSAAHDDNLVVEFSSDFGNTNYRGASYGIPVGSLAEYTANDTTFETVGTFTAAAANSCALIRMYWTNQNGLNHTRLQWTRPSTPGPGTTTEIVPSANLRDPSLAASASGCNGSINGSARSVALNKVLGSQRADANDQFTIEIGTSAAGGTLRQAMTSGSGTGQQAGTGAHVITASAASTIYLRESMSVGSVSTLLAYDSGIACTRNGTGFSATVVSSSATSRVWSVPMPASTTTNSQVLCSITNTARPILRLRKSLPTGRVLAADQFALAISGIDAGAAASVTTTGSTNAPTQVAVVSPATAGSVYAFTETAAAGANLANYTTTYACTNTLPAGQTPSGNAANFNVTPVAGDNLTCTFSNSGLPRADLSITKTNGQTLYAPGQTLTYSIVASNAGPGTAANAIFTDPAIANLTVTGVTCGSPGNGGVCPTVANTTVALMQGAGIVIPTLPATGSVTFTVTATVNAGATGNLVNTATVAAGPGNIDPTPGNNSATDTDTQSSVANLSVTKSNPPGNLVSGTSTTYSIVVTNNGPSAANNTTVRDNWTTVPGLDCSTLTGPPGVATCVASGTSGTACPAPAGVTPETLQAGVQIPSLPSGGIVTFTLLCRVTATGQ